jgi:hypothetical protein
MPQVGLEPTIPIFERAKIVHALDSAATVIGSFMWTKWLKQAGFKHEIAEFILKNKRSGHIYECTYFMHVCAKYVTPKNRK